MIAPPSLPSALRPGAREMVVMMAMLMALNALAIDTMLPALPAIGEALGVGVANHRQLVISFYLGGTAVGSLIFGPLADRFGRKRVLIGAVAAHIGFALGCAVARDFNLLLALRLANGTAGAALSVVVVAVIRDLFAGDAMAKRMSTIFLVFMVVPIIAPTLGAGILALANWRGIFVVLALMGGAMLVWLRRLPETMRPEDVRRLDLATLLEGWTEVTLHRRAAGYMLASAMVQASLFGYLNSSEQIIGEVFGARPLFPLVFACVAVGIAIANFSNARIVERFGARRVSQSAAFAFMGIALVQIAAARSGFETLPLFTVLMACNVGLVGFIGANFGSIAMEDFGHMAGIASSYQSFARSLVATLIGAGIGQLYNGTTLPLALSFLGCAVIGIVLVLWAEGGKLFTRPGTAPKSPL